MQQGDENPVLRINMAVIKSLQGDKSEAHQWLEQGINMGWLWYARSTKDPRLEELQNESRFEETIAKVKVMIDEMRKQVD
jgi:hypothetical protein